MNESDIEFTVGLDISPAEQKLNQFTQRVKQEAERTVPFQGQPKPASFQPTGDTAWDKLQLTNQRNLFRRQANAGWKALQSTTLPENERNMVFLQAAQKSKDAEKFDQMLKNLKKGSKDSVYDTNILEEQNILEGQNETQNEITDETKAQSREYNDHYIKLSKLHKLLLMILGVWQSIKKAIQANVDMSARLNEEKGFFSVDSRTAFQANRDKTYAAVHRGAENLGKAAPFTGTAFDAFLTQMQDLRFKAIRGEGIADEQYVISMQRLFDRLGVGESAKDLLSNGNVNLPELGVKMLNLLENKGLPALEKMSGIDRDLLSSDILKIFGKEIVNGVTAHLNKRAITSGNETAIEEMLRQGGNAVSFNDLTTATNDVTQAFSNFKKNIDELNQTLLVDTAPALTLFLDALSDLANWFSDKFNLGHFSEKRTGLVTTATIEQGPSGPYSRLFGTRIADMKPVFSDETKATVAAQKIIGDMDSYVRKVHANPNSTTEEKFNALLFNTRGARTSEFGTRIENLAGAYMLNKLAEWAKNGQLSDIKWHNMYSDVKGVGFGELGAAIAEKMKKEGGLPKNVKTYSDFLNYIYEDKNLHNIYTKHFAKGADWGIGIEGIVSPYKYFESIFTPEGMFDFLNLFTKDAGKEEFGDMIKAIMPEWYDKNKNGVIDLGEVRLVIDYNLPDNSTKTLELKQSASWR